MWRQIESANIKSNEHDFLFPFCINKLLPLSVLSAGESWRTNRTQHHLKQYELIEWTVCVCFSLVVSGSLDRVCRYTATDMQPCAAVEDAHMIKIPEQRYNIPLHRHFHRHGNSRILWRDTTRNCLRMIRLSLRSSYYRWMDLHGHWEIPNCDCPSHYTGGGDEEVWGPALFIRV